MEGREGFCDERFYLRMEMQRHNEGLLGITRFFPRGGVLLAQANGGSPSLPKAKPPTTNGSSDCFDGIDNDEDNYVDRDGGVEGEPPDDKCLALNQPSELGLIYTLRSSARVGPKGGLLILGDVELSIQEGALLQEVEITIERIPAKAPNTLSYLDDYRFYPEGLRFLKAVVGSYRVRENDPDFDDEEVVTPFEGMYHFSCAQGRLVFRSGDNITVMIGFDGFK